MSTVAIIFALDRELAPLVRSWQSSRFHHHGRNFRVYQHENLAAVAGGMGCSAAALAAQAMVIRYRPQLLISAGVAGALEPDLKVNDVLSPNVVVDSSTGKEYRSRYGNGVLVTAAEIADSATKKVLAKKFHASAVDMEASAVAEVAQRERIEFRCVKAISEEVDFVMPPLNEFVGGEGRFFIKKFLAWAAFHPAWWPQIMILARNTNRAAKALCDCLKDIGGNTPEPQPGDLPGKTTKVLDV